MTGVDMQRTQSTLRLPNSCSNMHTYKASLAVRRAAQAAENKNDGHSTQITSGVKHEEEGKRHKTTTHLHTRLRNAGHTHTNKHTGIHTQVMFLQ